MGPAETQAQRQNQQDLQQAQRLRQKGHASNYPLVNHKGRPVTRLALAAKASALYFHAMMVIFDMDDRARLPWRFFGAMHTVLARL